MVRLKDPPGNIDAVGRGRGRSRTNPLLFSLNSPRLRPHFTRSTFLFWLLPLLLMLTRTEAKAYSDERHSILPSAIFQDPPKALVVWPHRMVSNPELLQRPKDWEEKNFGQWCRNFTVDRHTQCPEASPFHWFVCCGQDGVECCAGVQTWAYVVFGSVVVSTLIISMFYLLLHFNLVCGRSESEKSESRECMVDSPCTLLTAENSTPPSSPSTSSCSPCTNIGKGDRKDGASPDTVNSGGEAKYDIQTSDSCHSSLVVIVENHNNGNITPHTQRRNA